MAVAVRKEKLQWQEAVKKYIIRSSTTFSQMEKGRAGSRCCVLSPTTEGERQMGLNKTDVIAKLFPQNEMRADKY